MVQKRACHETIGHRIGKQNPGAATSAAASNCEGGDGNMSYFNWNGTHYHYNNI